MDIDATGTNDRELPVIAPGVAHPCRDDESCEICVTRWIERRALAESGSAPNDDATHITLSIPLAGAGRPRERRILRRRLARLAVEAVLTSQTDRRLVMRFERGTCPLHLINKQAEGLSIRLDLSQASASFDGGETAVPDAPTHGLQHDVLDPWRRIARSILDHRELALVIVSGLLLLAGFLIKVFDGSDAVRLPLLGLSAVLSSTTTFPAALAVLKTVRLDVDVLMFVAAIGAASLGQYEEGAFLLFLFGLGSAGEHLALNRARRAVEALSDLAPEFADRIDDDGEVTRIPVEDVEVGQNVVVRPFDRLPLDGEVVHGLSAIDQSPVTGESVLVDKAPGDEVFAGTVNTEGELVVRVIHAAGESTLARIMRMVEEAQAQKSPAERFTARVESIYVPIVMVATLVAVLLPPLAEWETWGNAFYRAMAFLVAASPCAIAIGTPAAVLCGLGRSARLGVLMKGGAALESLGRIEAFAFDKTGTLTQGRPRVVAVEPLGDRTERDVLSMAAGVEAGVNHPLAECIVDHARDQGLEIPEVDGLRQIAGTGAVGTLGGRQVGVGRASLATAGVLDDAHAVASRWTSTGATVAWVVDNDQPVGIIAMADEPRAEAAEALTSLKKLGVAAMAMITGDHADAAQAVAAKVGINEVRADVMPAEKLEAVETLRREHGSVAMVGDGVNDAPALAAADVGIAMGAAGTDVAMETADIVLMGSDLRLLPKAVGLSNAARRMIVQNLIIALSVICVVSPLALVGVADLGWAVVLHEGSTVVVVLNALRLLRWGKET